MNEWEHDRLELGRKVAWRLRVDNGGSLRARQLRREMEAARGRYRRWLRDRAAGQGSLL